MTEDNALVTTKAFKDSKGCRLRHNDGHIRTDLHTPVVGPAAGTSHDRTGQRVTIRSGAS
jgi:hypothetical protein